MNIRYMICPGSVQPFARLPNATAVLREISYGRTSVPSPRGKHFLRPILRACSTSSTIRYNETVLLSPRQACLSSLHQYNPTIPSLTPQHSGATNVALQGHLYPHPFSSTYRFPSLPPKPPIDTLSARPKHTKGLATGSKPNLYASSGEGRAQKQSTSGS